VFDECSKGQDRAMHPSANHPARVFHSLALNPGCPHHGMRRFIRRAWAAPFSCRGIGASGCAPFIPARSAAEQSKDSLLQLRAEATSCAAANQLCGRGRVLQAHHTPWSSATTFL